MFKPKTLDNKVLSLSKQKGFTLIELMVTLVIIVTVYVIAAPALTYQLARIEANTVHRVLTMSLRQSKVVSYGYHYSVLLCFLNKNGKCDKYGNDRLVLFRDLDNNNLYNSDVDELIDSRLLNLSYGSLQLVASNRHYIKFSGNTGMPRGFFGHIKYCSTVDDGLSYQFSFSQTGRYSFNSKISDSHNGCYS